MRSSCGRMWQEVGIGRVISLEDAPARNAKVHCGSQLGRDFNFALRFAGNLQSLKCFESESWENKLEEALPCADNCIFRESQDFPISQTTRTRPLQLCRQSRTAGRSTRAPGTMIFQITIRSICSAAKKNYFLPISTPTSASGSGGAGNAADPCHYGKDLFYIGSCWQWQADADVLFESVRNNGQFEM